MKRAVFALLIAALTQASFAQGTSSTSDAKTIFAHVQAATVVVLAGEGAGRLQAIATGVLVTKDGAILTALHAIKNFAEVQVRLSNGEVFDHVELLGSDERRDVAAIKISAVSLPALPTGTSANTVQGDAVYAVTNSNGLSWSATQGIISAVRPADEVPGAGEGYRLIQFNAPIAPGASGGPLVDSNGVLVGIITRADGSAGFAVPIESVLGLSAAAHGTPLGSGASLQMPAKLAAAVPQSSAAIAGGEPKQILRTARTVYIRSKTQFLTVDTLDQALVHQKGWGELGLTIVQDPRVADVFIELDRPLFTYIHTFVISDKKTSMVLGSGKVTAIDGTIASEGIAKDIVKTFSAARVSSTAKN